MKKFLAVILVLLLALTSTAALACGKKKTPAKPAKCPTKQVQCMKKRHKHHKHNDHKHCDNGGEPDDGGDDITVE